MDLATVGWIVLGWFAVALALSLVLGVFLHKADVARGDEELVVAAPKQQAMRFMRGRKLANVRESTGFPRVRELGKRSNG
jgi:hypothetical protein